MEKAIGYHEKALVISGEIGDRSGEGNHLGNLGNAYAALEQMEKAIGYHERALAISREAGFRRGDAINLANLGNVYMRMRQVDEAIPYYQQALAIGQEIEDPEIISIANAALERLRGTEGGGPPAPPATS